MEINKDILFMDYPPLKITEETRKKVIENPKWHFNCPLGIRMGRFYTDEEWYKRSKKMSLVKLPGDKKLILKK